MTETREGTDVVEPDDVLRTLAEWHTTLRQWSGSAFIAGEDIGDTDGAREQLYGDLCRLGNETTWMEEQVTLLRSENEALKEALRPFFDGFSYDPGHSDLDNEQPISVRVQLGDWRRARRHLTARKEGQGGGA